MAESKTTTTRGRKPKTTVESVKEETTSSNEIIEKLMAQLESQNKIIAEMQSKFNNLKEQSSYIKTEEKFGGKKVKCINLLQCSLNLSTEPNGQGRTYSFEKYGDSRMIKFDDLNDIVATYPMATEKGFFYITNQDVVEYLDLVDEYKNIYTKEMIDSIIKLNNDSDVDLFIGMGDELKKTTSIAIAERINKNERMDYNHLQRIKDECGIDIQAIAKELKENFKKKTDSEE